MVGEITDRSSDVCGLSGSPAPPAISQQMRHLPRFASVICVCDDGTRPRKNSVSYHGVLAPRHRFRNQVILEPPAHTEERTRLTKKPRGSSRWHPWADLLWRVFDVDGLACACGGRLVLHAIVQPPATLGVLESLERSPANRQPRAPPQVA